MTAAVSTAVRHFQLSPSDFAFLWEECRRCFYLKVVCGIRRPTTPMPKIFMAIDSAMKDCFDGRRTEEILSNLPTGVLAYSDRLVESVPMMAGDPEVTVSVRGKFDTVIRFDDGTFAVIDFKTASVNSAHIPLYSRQLHSYAWALENPAKGRLHLSPVTRLGLLVFEPSLFNHDSQGKCELAGGLKWVEIQRNDEQFLRFMQEVMAVLADPETLDRKKCQWCSGT